MISIIHFATAILLMLGCAPNSQPSVNDLLHGASFHKAPLLGETCEELLVSWYAYDAENLYNMMCSEDKNSNKQEYERLRNSNTRELEKQLDEIEAKSRGETNEAKRRKLMKDMVDKALEIDNVKLAVRAKSACAYFVLRLERYKEIMRLSPDGFRPKILLASFKVLGEKVNGNDGILRFCLKGEDNEHDIHFRKEGGCWRVVGLREFKKLLDVEYLNE